MQEIVGACRLSLCVWCIGCRVVFLVVVVVVLMVVVVVCVCVCWFLEHMRELHQRAATQNSLNEAHKFQSRLVVIEGLEGGLVLQVLRLPKAQLLCLTTSIVHHQRGPTPSSGG